MLIFKLKLADLLLLPRPIFTRSALCQTIIMLRRISLHSSVRVCLFKTRLRRILVIFCSIWILSLIQTILWAFRCIDLCIRNLKVDLIIQHDVVGHDLVHLLLAHRYAYHFVWAFGLFEFWKCLNILFRLLIFNKITKILLLYLSINEIDIFVKWLCIDISNRRVHGRCGDPGLMIIILLPLLFLLYRPHPLLCLQLDRHHFPRRYQALLNQLVLDALLLLALQDDFILSLCSLQKLRLHLKRVLHLISTRNLILVALFPWQYFYLFNYFLRPHNQVIASNLLGLRVTFSNGVLLLVGGVVLVNLFWLEVVLIHGQDLFGDLGFVFHVYFSKLATLVKWVILLCKKLVLFKKLIYFLMAVLTPLITLEIVLNLLEFYCLIELYWLLQFVPGGVIIALSILLVSCWYHYSACVNFFLWQLVIINVFNIMEIAKNVLLFLWRHSLNFKILQKFLCVLHNELLFYRVQILASRHSHP